MFSHWVNNEGIGVIKHLLYPHFTTSMRQNARPMTMYTNLEVARVGLTEHSLKEYYGEDEYVTKTRKFKSNDRSFLTDSEEGFVRIHFARVTGKVL